MRFLLQTGVPAAPNALETGLAALSGWVAAIVAGATVIVLVATLKQMRRASEVQTQAYVYASRAKFGDFNNILIWCRNTGLTPATHFTINGEAGIVKQGTVSSSISFSNHGWKTWTALGASDELSVGIDTDPETVRRFRSGETERDVVLMVCGQIVYCTVDNHDHVTQFVFYVDAHNRTLFRRPTNNVKSFHRVAAA